MAAATATIATRPPALDTPVSATYPSELRSPLVGTPTFIKREEDMKTPITPPAAYVDFLKALSPTLMSPLATGSSQKFPINEGGRVEKGKTTETPKASTTERPSTSTSDDAAAAASPPDSRPEPAATHPPLSRNVSTESADSAATSTTTSSAVSATSTASAPTPMQSNTSRPRSNTSTSTTRPEIPHPIQIPPTSSGAFSRPASARRTPRGTPLHMHIPGVSSPYSPSVPSPLSGGARSARSIQSPFGSTMSPYSATMSPYNTSAGPWSANAMSPRDRETQGQIASPPVTGSGTSRVSVRQVVTRTVTYSRTPLDPPPKGKRRRVEDEEDNE
ncbi:hypothetical protein EV356DRAFT_515573 [Viridothelium virens]|uniref:Uncharacterized protein n=1 Tax=Viridothelium virens TaxID=1048519 RepID=A0A6A6HMW5_VIRVR|nr:hypothetical protein EV356DRAFT_515573 [Viridothelium virens]